MNKASISYRWSFLAGIYFLPFWASANGIDPMLSYALGVKVVEPLIRESISVDSHAFLQGAHDALTGTGLKMSQEDIAKEINQFMDNYQRQKQQQLRMIAQKNLEEGHDFLAQNKNEKGIVTLPSGLQYRIISSAGVRKHPGPKDLVTAHYRGKLIDGTEFDSSYARGEAAKFRVDQVIAGWTEALQLMAPGDRWEVFIPSELAYGSFEPNEEIGPNRTLIFEIELVDYETSKV
jgi:FKBP-type peptidyl-prolyl cis-trans isomerase FklB